MALTTALNNAASGLRATSRAAELVASNIANAATPGYVRRELVLTNDPLGGVLIAGVSRPVDPLVIADRRLAEAQFAAVDLAAGGLARIETAIGDPTQAGSLAERIARLEARLTDAATRPDVDARLAAAVTAADDLTRGIGDVSRTIQDVRTRADNDIATMVDRVNAALRQVDDLNDEIVRVGGKALAASNLVEQRQQAIDSIAEILPIREVPRQNGTVALFTNGGAVILEGEPQFFGFTPTGIITPAQTLADGALSGLTIGRTEIDTTAARSLLGEGALQAAFDLRDRTAPAAQATLDALARDLIDRFQDPALDASLGPTDAGLFTDNGLAFDPLNEEGLALRLEVNAAVDPARGGDLWRLRDGIGAAAEGPPGDSALLTSFSERLRLPRAPASGPAAGQTLSFSAQANAFLSGVASDRQAGESALAFGAARLESIRVEEAGGGVDTDDELQKLLTIEQNYGANARVLQTLDTLLDQILSIT